MKVGMNTLRKLIREAIEARVAGPSYDQGINPGCMACDDSGRALCSRCRGMKCHECGYMGEVSCKECGMGEGVMDVSEKPVKKEG